MQCPRKAPETSYKGLPLAMLQLLKYCKVNLTSKILWLGWKDFLKTWLELVSWVISLFRLQMVRKGNLFLGISREGLPETLSPPPLQETQSDLFWLSFVDEEAGTKVRNRFAQGYQLSWDKNLHPLLLEFSILHDVQVISISMEEVDVPGQCRSLVWGGVWR